MADYGVNIAVAVKNSQAVTQLSGKIKETGLRVNQLNNLIENFADITGTTVVNSVRNFNKALSDACLLYTSPSPRDVEESRMPSSA